MAILKTYHVDMAILKTTGHGRAGKQPKIVSNYFSSLYIVKAVKKNPNIGFIRNTKQTGSSKH